MRSDDTAHWNDPRITSVDPARYDSPWTPLDSTWLGPGPKPDPIWRPGNAPRSNPDRAQARSTMTIQEHWGRPGPKGHAVEVLLIEGDTLSHLLHLDYREWASEREETLIWLCRPTFRPYIIKIIIYLTSCCLGFKLV